MQILILTLSILVLITLVITYFTSPEGLENLEKIQAIFNKINPNFEEEEGSLRTKLANEIFYNYHHERVSDWKFWIQAQGSNTKALALKLLENHLTGEAKHWGNISSEALDGIQAFEEFDLAETLYSFLKKASPLWLEYLVIPSLYKKALDILYKVDANKAIKFVLSEFTPLKIQNDPAFKQKANLIISNITKDESIGPKCLVSIINDEKVPVDIQKNAFKEILKLGKDLQKTTLNKILQPYLIDKTKIERRNNELETDYETRLEILKSIIENMMQFISSPDIFQTLTSLCKKDKRLRRMVHNKVLSIINNSNSELEFSQLIAFNYLPDTEDKKIKIALAKQKGLPQSQVREIVLKPRLKSSRLDTLMNRKNQELPIPSCQEDSFKSLSKKLGRTKEDICNGITNNTLLLVGNDRLRKAYLCHSITQRAGLNLIYLDLKFIHSDSSLFSARKQMEESDGLIYIESLEEFIRTKDTDLKAKLDTFLSELKSLSKRNDLRFIFSLNHSKAVIEKDIKLNLFYKMHLKNNIADHLELNSSGNYKKNVIDHYANHMKLKSEDFSGFTEEFHSNNNFSNALEYEFACIEELSTQLLVFGKPSSYLKVASQRKNLFGKVPLTPSS